MDNQNSDTNNSLIPVEPSSINQTESSAHSLDQLTLEVKFYLNQIGQNAIEVGKRLTQAKDTLLHGDWQNWLKDNFNFESTYGSKFYGDFQTFFKNAFKCVFENLLATCKQIQNFREVLLLNKKRSPPMRTKNLKTYNYSAILAERIFYGKEYF